LRSLEPPVGSGALVKTIVAPTAAQAQSTTPCGTGSCPAGTTCCTTAGAALCCNNTTSICQTNLCVACGDPGHPCCAGGTCVAGLVCQNGTRLLISDRALKHQLMSVASQDALAALGL
jgi:hypothetical protein